MSSVRRLGPASIASPRTPASLLVALFVGLALASCNTPTQVSVLVTTDMPCERIQGVTVTAGLVGEIDKKPRVGFSDLCTPTDDPSRNRIGEIIVVPDGDKNDEFAIKVVAGVDIKADSCTPKDDYAGCIVARRALNFIPHKMLDLPVFLSGSCEGVGCTARQNETCVLGACVPAQITNPDMCDAEQTTTCDEGVLTGGDKPPEPAPVGCGRPSVITDNFDGAEATHWRAETPPLDAAVVQEAGALVLTPPTTAAEPTEVRRRSYHTVNLDRDAITVRVAEMLDTATEARAYLAAELDQGNRMLIEQKQGKLSFLHTDEAGKLVGPTVDYEPAKHVWWEIRDTGENVVMRTSMNGKTWEVGALFPKPPYADRVHIVLGAGADKPVPKPGSVKFDDLNQGRPKAGWCPVSTFSDNFEDEVRSPIWELEEEKPGECTATEAGGLTTFQNDGLVDNDCYLRSKTAFDLTGNSIVVKIEGVPTTLDSAAFFYLGLKDDYGDKVQVGLRTVDMALQSFYLFGPKGETNPQGAGGPVMTPVWLRIHEAEGTIYWHASADGIEWGMPLYTSVPKQVDVTAVHVTLGLQAYSTFASSPAIVNVAEVTSGPAP